MTYIWIFVTYACISERISPNRNGNQQVLWCTCLCGHSSSPLGCARALPFLPSLCPMMSHGCHSRVSISEQNLGFIKSNCGRRTYSATVVVEDKHYHLRGRHKSKFKKSIMKNYKYFCYSWANKDTTEWKLTLTTMQTESIITLKHVIDFNKHEHTDLNRLMIIITNFSMGMAKDVSNRGLQLNHIITVIKKLIVMCIKRLISLWWRIWHLLHCIKCAFLENTHTHRLKSMSDFSVGFVF